MGNDDMDRGAGFRSGGRAFAVVVALVALASPAGGLSAQDDASPERAFAVSGPAFLAVVVEDLDGAVDWYGRGFGLRVVNTLDAEDGAYAIRILSDGTLTVELLRLRDALPRPTASQAGLFKTGLFVDDIDVAHAWFRRHAEGTDRRVLHDEALDVRYFVTRDPFGNRIQLLQPCSGRC